MAKKCILAFILIIILAIFLGIFLTEDNGYVDVYMVVYLRYGQYLSNDEFEYLERNIPECFEKGHVWLYEINYRRRFRLRIQLIRCLKKDFQRVIRKGIHKIDSTTDRL